MELVTTHNAAEASASDASFAVHFSDPARLARLGAPERSNWKLHGAGQIVLDPQNLVLRGSRPRLFWTSAKHEVTIPRASIVNAVQEGRLVQCHVQLEGTSNRALKFWAEDEDSARRIVELLPKDKTPQFERLVTEQSDFATALQAVGGEPVITIGLVVINCGVFILAAAAGAGFLRPDTAVLIHWGTNYGPLTLQGDWWRLFTSMFLHFGLIHLLLNMWALLSIGWLTEKLFGSAYFLVLYLFAGLCGSVASLLWHPDINSAGASGAIFGVLGGLLAYVLNPRTRTRIPISVAASQRNSALIFAAYNLFTGFTHAGIDNACHIGGLLGGFAMGWFLARPLEVEARRRPAGRLAVSMIAGAVMLTAVSWPLFHPGATIAAERHFRHEFQLFADEEQTAVASENSIDQLLKTNKINQHEWGRRIHRDVLPVWEAAERQMATGDLPADSQLAALQKALRDYIDAKRLSLDLLSDAARYDDSEKLEQGGRVAAGIAAKALLVRTLARGSF